MELNEITFQPFDNQYLCLQYLMDNETTEILYGGAMGGGKSHLGCAWIIMSCLKYPGTRYCIARSRISTLKNTTIKTFQDIVKLWNIEDRVDYHLFNNHITFKNGSEVLLMDLFLYPQDPDFVKLGSLELTGALIDEAAEICEKAYTILTTRIRYKLNEYNLIPKLLIVSNPTRGWLYNNFYKMDRDGTIPKYRKFIRSLSTDNPYQPIEYIESLKRLPTLDRKRLFEGQWEFHKDDFDLFNIDNLYNMFQIRSVANNKKYITCDVASTGSDRTVITYWEGLLCRKIDVYTHLDTTQIVDKIRSVMNDKGVNVGNVIVDAIGVGSGVADLLKGCKRFVAGSKPLNNEQFNHIKSQMFFKLAEKINQNEIGIIYDHSIDDIVDELISHRRYKGDRDGKFQITPKELIKATLGKSPDIADALMMRMYFEYTPEISFTFI